MDFQDVPSSEEALKMFSSLSLVGQTAVYVVIVSIVRIILEHGVFKAVGKFFGIKDERSRSKFAEASWFFSFYFVAFTFALYQFGYKEGWLFNTADYWVCNRAVSPDEVHPDIDPLVCPGGIYEPYSLIQLGQYTAAMLFLLTPVLTSRKGHKDFAVMMIHHFAAGFVIYLSIVFGYLRVGVAIMMVHDVSDIFLESAKMFKYLENSNFQKMVGINPGTIMNVDFVVFAAVFAVSRLYVYPRYLLRSVWYEMYEFLEQPRRFMNPGRYFCSPMLWILQALHVYWFYLIMRMIIRAVREKNVAKDIRSDSESD